MVGFSTVWKVPQNNYADIYVGFHPAWRRRGIGSELLQRTVARAQTHQPQTILVSADSQHQEAKDFLQKRAFSPLAAYILMRLASTFHLPQPVLPTGYTLRAYNPASDFSLLLNMYNRAFQGLYRKKNLYLPQLLHVARWVRKQERVDIEMESWGDDTRVLAQYQGVGFENVHQQDIYRWQDN